MAHALEIERMRLESHQAIKLAELQHAREANELKAATAIQVAQISAQTALSSASMAAQTAAAAEVSEDLTGAE